MPRIESSMLLSALSAKLRQVLTDPVRMSEMSARNLQFAANYRSELTEKRRHEFYDKLREGTATYSHCMDQAAFKR